MKKKQSIVFILILIFILISIFIYPHSKNNSQYNIILISIDTLRPDHMSVYGYSKKTTPRIDDWSKDAFVFNNVYTSAPMTYPSFITFMTGNHPLRNNIVNNTEYSDDIDADIPHKIIDKDATTLAKVLKENGYTTAAFAGNYILSPEAANNINSGFDTYQSLFDWAFPREVYESFLERAINWIDGNKNKKFFLWIHLMDPHAPYKPSEKYQCIFDKKYCDEINSTTIDQLDKEREELQGCGKNVSQDKLDVFKNLYDGEIRSVDSLVGTILDEIRSQKLDKNTVVILYGDHGEGFDHNYNFVHGDMLYNSSIKIPLIIMHPDFSNIRKQNNLLIENTDIFPTILDLLHIKYEPQLDGISFAASITGEKNNTVLRKYTIAVNKTKKRYSISDGIYKLIITNADEKCKYEGITEELYNIKTDPNELKNIFSIESSRAKIMHNKLQDYIGKFKNNGIENEASYKQKINNELKKEMLRSLGY